MTNRIFVMSESFLKSRKTKGSKESCQTCGIKIKVDDSVVTGLGMRKGGRLIRHESCARRVGIIE